MYQLTSAKFLMRIIFIRSINLSVLVDEMILTEEPLHYLFMKCSPILHPKVYLKYFAIFYFLL